MYVLRTFLMTSSPAMLPNEITVNNAAAMFRRPSSPNDPPYTQANKKENNRRVDDWSEQLLAKVATNGTLPAPVVLPLWNLYVGGFEVPSTLRAAEDELTPSVSPVQVAYWKKFFEEAKISDLWVLGKPVTGLGWSVIMNQIRFSDASNKNLHLYEGSSDPSVWYKRSLEKRDLFAETTLPFWTMKQFQEIYELVTSFLAFRTGPQR